MKKWDSYNPNLLNLEQSLFFSDLVRGMHARVRVVIFVSQAFRVVEKEKRENARSRQTRWSFKLWAKAAAGNGVFYFYAVIYLDWYAYITAKLFAISVVTLSPALLFIAIFVIKMLIYLQISTTFLFKVNLCLSSKKNRIIHRKKLLRLK